VSDSEPSEEPFDTHLDIGLLVGVWSDFAVVHRERDVSTIDFVRTTPVTSERILVARVLVVSACGGGVA
jgi:hypothetical protein